MTQAIKSVDLSLDQPCKVLDLVADSDDFFAEPHRHNYWELLWCLDDKGSQGIDFVEYPNKLGRIFTISPNQVHDSNQMCEHVRLIVFSTDFLEEQHRNNLLMESLFGRYQSVQPYIDLDPAVYSYLEPLFLLMEEECRRDEPDWDIVSSLLTSFLRYLLRFSVKERAPSLTGDRRIPRFVELVEQYYRREKICQFYADKLSLTGKRLNELTRKYLGKTVTQYIHGRIILEANRELIYSNKTIKAIALELGFDDPSYFGRFYRKCSGESPAEFRVRCSDSTLK